MNSPEDQPPGIISSSGTPPETPPQAFPEDADHVIKDVPPQAEDTDHVINTVPPQPIETSPEQHASATGGSSFVTCASSDTTFLSCIGESPKVVVASSTPIKHQDEEEEGEDLLSATTSGDTVKTVMPGTSSEIQRVVSFTLEDHHSDPSQRGSSSLLSPSSSSVQVLPSASTASSSSVQVLTTSSSINVICSDEEGAFGDAREGMENSPEFGDAIENPPAGNTENKKKETTGNSPVVEKREEEATTRLPPQETEGISETLPIEVPVQARLRNSLSNETSRSSMSSIAVLGTSSQSQDQLILEEEEEERAVFEERVSEEEEKIKRDEEEERKSREELITPSSESSQETALYASTHSELLQSPAPEVAQLPVPTSPPPQAITPQPTNSALQIMSPSQASSPPLTISSPQTTLSPKTVSPLQSTPSSETTSLPQGTSPPQTISPQGTSPPQTISSQGTSPPQTISSQKTSPPQTISSQGPSPPQTISSQGTSPPQTISSQGPSPPQETSPENKLFSRLAPATTPPAYLPLTVATPPLSDTFSPMVVGAARQEGEDLEDSSTEIVSEDSKVVSSTGIVPEDSTVPVTAGLVTECTATSTDKESSPTVGTEEVLSLDATEQVPATNPVTEDSPPPNIPKDSPPDAVDHELSPTVEAESSSDMKLEGSSSNSQAIKSSQESTSDTVEGTSSGAQAGSTSSTVEASLEIPTDTISSKEMATEADLSPDLCFETATPEEPESHTGDLEYSKQPVGSDEILPGEGESLSQEAEFLAQEARNLYPEVQIKKTLQFSPSDLEVLSRIEPVEYCSSVDSTPTPERAEEVGEAFTELSFESGTINSGGTATPQRVDTRTGSLISTVSVPESMTGISEEYQASDLFLARLANIVPRENISEITRKQKYMLNKLECTNEKLRSCNQLSAHQFNKARDNFTHYTRLLIEMRRDVETAFKRIQSISGRLEEHYPAVWGQVSSEVLTDWVHPDTEDKEEEEERRRRRRGGSEEPARIDLTPPNTASEGPTTYIIEDDEIREAPVQTAHHLR